MLVNAQSIHSAFSLRHIKFNSKAHPRTDSKQALKFFCVRTDITIKGMLKIARSGVYRFAAVKRASSLFAAGALRCRGIAACSQALRSFTLQANTQFSTLR
jgi:hypothetical protein